MQRSCVRGCHAHWQAQPGPPAGGVPPATAGPLGLPLGGGVDQARPAAEAGLPQRRLDVVEVRVGKARLL
eukprot:COSAG04_NODE_18827_length_431_cov_1.819277_2_plen_69_part_01